MALSPRLAERRLNFPRRQNSQSFEYGQRLLGAELSDFRTQMNKAMRGSADAGKSQD